MDNKLVRLSCNLNKETAEALKTLAADSGLSMTEVIRRAIGIYKYVCDETDEGRMVVTMGRDWSHPRELVLLG